MIIIGEGMQEVPKDLINADISQNDVSKPGIVKFASTNFV